MALTQQRRAKFIKRWAIRRAKGKKRFLAWGTMVLTLALIAGEILRKRSWDKVFDELPVYAVICLGISLTFAAIAWRENERAYRRYLTAKSNTKVDPGISTREA